MDIVIVKKPLQKRLNNTETPSIILGIYAEALWKMLYKSLGGKRRILTAALLSTLLTAALAGALLVNLAAANFMLPPEIPPLAITIQLPENKVYAENSIPIAFTIQRSYQVTRETYNYSLYMFDEPDLYTCFLDGKEMILTPNQVSAETDYYLCKRTLSGLSEGTHSLVIFVHYTYRFTIWSNTELRHTSGYSGTAFTVNAAAPRVSVLSPKRAKTYNTTTLPLNFTVSEPAAWLGYSLDGETPVTITGNTTLSGLSNGTHTIVVQAEDTAGSTGASTPITFKVKTQDTQPQQTESSETGPQPSEPFPTTWIAAAIVIIAVVGVALLIYFTKIRKTTGGENVTPEGVM